MIGKFLRLRKHRRFVESAMAEASSSVMSSAFTLAGCKDLKCKEAQNHLASIANKQVFLNKYKYKLRSVI